MTFDEDFLPPLKYCHNLNLQMPTPATQSHQPRLPHGSIPGNTPSYYDTRYSWNAKAYHDPGVLASAHVAPIQTHYNLGSWIPSNLQSVAEALPTPCLPTVVKEKHADHVMSPSHSAHDPGQNIARWESHTPSSSPSVLRLTSSGRQPLSPLVDDDISTLHYFLDQSSSYPSHACTSHATLPHHVSSEPSIPHHCPPYQPFSPASLHFGPYPTSTGFLEIDPRPYAPFYRVPSRRAASSSRRRSTARAIEYDGLWLDEEELIKGLTEPDGKLTVHQCRWEEDHSPCHLWIIGDESCINLHIQRWHGGKPGGDRSRVDCRWSACGKKMRKDSIARHIVSIHLGETWVCQGCGKGIVRSDAYRQHAMRSEFDACRASGALITYSGVAREIDACAAMKSA